MCACAVAFFPYAGFEKRIVTFFYSISTDVSKKTVKNTVVCRKKDLKITVQDIYMDYRTNKLRIYMDCRKVPTERNTVTKCFYAI